MTSGAFFAPFAGEAGRLLDNMLRALRLHDGRVPVHLMRTRRAAPSGREAATPSAGTDFVALAGALLSGLAGPAAYADPSVIGDGSIVGDCDYIDSANPDPG